MKHAGNETLRLLALLLESLRQLRGMTERKLQVIRCMHKK